VFLLNTFRVVDRMNQQKNPSFNKKMTQSQKGDKDEEVGQSLTSLIGISYHNLLDVPSRVGGGSMLIGSMWVSQPSKVLVA
jgi:hypothetical protein